MSCNGPPLLTLANESNNNNLSTEQELMRELDNRMLFHSLMPTGMDTMLKEKLNLMRPPLPV